MRRTLSIVGAVILILFAAYLIITGNVALPEFWTQVAGGLVIAAIGLLGWGFKPDIYRFLGIEGKASPRPAGQTGRIEAQYVHIEHWAYADSVLLSRKPFNGYLWLLVGMSIENHGYDRIPMDWNNFVVVMSHGGKKHQFNAHSPTRSFSQPLLTNDILNGLTAYGYLIYEIPGNFDPTKCTLLYKPQSGNYDVRYANRGVQIRLSRADSDRSI